MKAKDKTPGELSPVFAQGEAARPRVRQPQSPLSLWAGLGGAAVLGLMVFNGLNSGREARAQTTAPAPAPTPAPVQAAPAPTPIQQPAPIVQQAPQAMQALPQQNPNEAYWRAPTMVVDFSAPAAEAAPTQVAQASQAGPGGLPPGSGGDPRESSDERFAARVSGGQVDIARAHQMRNLGLTVPQGATIAAVLETAINSDLPGSVRAVVSRDVRSFDGSRVLIPRGSKLVGQYKSGAAIGQTRAFVVWTRIITPTGVSIDVGSPATDRLGRGGLDGEVDTHFFRRFGSSILLSVVSAGSQALANSLSSNNTTLVIGSPAQATQVASAALEKQMSIPDTIKVAQGVPVQVSVARDLDFSGVMR